MNYIIRELLEPLRTALFDYKWRKRNLQNRTHAGTRFPLDKVSVGNGTYGRLNVIDYNDPDSGNLKIGNYCSIARTVLFMLAGNHAWNTLSTYPFDRIFLNERLNQTKGDIVIDDDVWIGERVTVLSGVHIGQGAIVAAGALVTKDVPPYSVVGGVNCKVLFKRFPDDVISVLSRLDLSLIDEDFIKKHREKLLAKLDPNDMDWLEPLLKNN